MTHNERENNMGETNGKLNVILWLGGIISSIAILFCTTINAQVLKNRDDNSNEHIEIINMQDKKFEILSQKVEKVLDGQIEVKQRLSKIEAKL